MGTPIANRTRRETEGLIGFFVNTLVMRHDLSGDPRFVELLKRTRCDGAAGVCASGRAVRAAGGGAEPERSVSHSPLFQVMFALQNTPLEALELPGLAVQPLETGAARGEETIARGNGAL